MPQDVVLYLCIIIVRVVCCNASLSHGKNWTGSLMGSLMGSLVGCTPLPKFVLLRGVASRVTAAPGQLTEGVQQCIFSVFGYVPNQQILEPDRSGCLTKRRGADFRENGPKPVQTSPKRFKASFQRLSMSDVNRNVSQKGPKTSYHLIAKKKLALVSSHMCVARHWRTLR